MAFLTYEDVGGFYQKNKFIYQINEMFPAVFQRNGYGPLPDYGGSRSQPGHEAISGGLLWGWSVVHVGRVNAGAKHERIHSQAFPGSGCDGV